MVYSETSSIAGSQTTTTKDYMYKKISMFAMAAAALSLGSLGSASADHSQDRPLEGFYSPTSGEVHTTEVSRPELGETPMQLGTVKTKLSRTSGEGARRLKLKGQVHGKVIGVNPVTQLPILAHTIVSKQRDGVLYSSGDEMNPATVTVEVCGLAANGTPLVILSGTEVINFVSGTGKFSGFVSGSLSVQGTVNQCSGQNDFVVLANEGGLLFQ